jgi:hypothetical protein
MHPVFLKHHMTVEYLLTEGSDHAFNLINRDQRTPLFEPEKWNENSLVVDAWMGSVYTKKGFCVANAKLPFECLRVVLRLVVLGF